MHATKTRPAKTKNNAPSKKYGTYKSSAAGKAETLHRKQVRKVKRGEI